MKDTKEHVGLLCCVYFININMQLSTDVFNVCSVFHNVDPTFERRLYNTK